MLSIFQTAMRSNYTAKLFLFNLPVFVLASLLGAAAAFAQPACDPGFTDDDTIAAAMDVDDDNDGLIEICNLAGLNHIRHNLAGTSYKDSSTAAGVQCGASSATDCTGYELVEDLDFEDAADAGYDVAWTAGDGGVGWLPLGHDTDKEMSGFQGTPFSGSFDGGEKVIRNLFINRDEDRVGLFGQLGATGSIADLGVEDVVVEGERPTGGLVGETLESATITSCHATGVVTSRSGNAGVLVGKSSGTITLCYATGIATGQSRTGILVGESSGTIRSCHSAGSAESSSEGNAGGLVGRNVRGTITSCYSTGSALVPGETSVGGLVGFSSGGTIKWCYATGAATSRLEGAAAGLVGLSFGTEITSCYSTGAAKANGNPKRGLVRNNGDGTVLNSFWDTDTSGVTTAGAGTGKTTAEMKALTLEMLGDSGGLSWDVGTTDQYPAVKSYKETGGTQVAGDLLVGQPCPRAGDCDAFAGGTGTEGDPYQILSVKQLDAIREDFLDDHFVLVNDLDFDGYVYSENAKGWLPIGHDTDKDTGGFQGTAFSGSFDGGGYVIRNLFISRADEDYVGLFGLLLTGSLLKNLGVKGVVVEGDERVGGLVGELSGELRSCYATGQVTGMVSIGGLLGYNDQGTVTSCYSTVSATSRGSEAGGFVGHNKGEITSCYSTGAVTGGSAQGGFAGANVGGTVSMSFWDTEASGITTAGAGTGKTTAQMKELTLTELGDSDGLSWDVGTMDQYPEVSTYIENEAGDQVQGDLLAAQPCPRPHCDPLVSIEALDSQFNEEEVSSAVFRLTRTGYTATELIVEVNVTGSHLTARHSVEFIFQAGIATLNVNPGIGNEMDEEDWTFTMTIIEDPSRYRLGNASASVTIIDDDLPEVSITAAAASVTEGTDAAAAFTVSRPTWDVTADLVVTLAVDGGTADFLEPAQNLSPTVTIPAGETSVGFEVGIVDDEVDEADGTLTVTVSPMPSVYTFSGALTYSLIPAVPSGLNFAAETRTLSSTPDMEQDATEYTYTATDAFGNEESLTFTITVNAEGTPTFAGTIGHQTYTKDSSIEALMLPLATGGTGTLTYTLTPTLPNGLSFDANTRMLTGMPDTVGSATQYTYTVTDTSSNEASLTFTITITEADTTDPVFFVSTLDNQTYTANTAIAPLVLPAAATFAMVEVVDDELPVVSIVKTTDAREGESALAVFTVDRVGLTTAPLDVKVGLAFSGDFSFSAGTEATVTINANETTATLEVGVTDNAMDQADGTITATLLAFTPATYEIGSSMEVEATISDDDLPSITSFAIGDSSSFAIDEGAKTITVTVPQGTALTGVDPVVITVRSDASVTPPGAQTFTAGMAVTYTVTAGGDAVMYEVTVEEVSGTPPGVPGSFSVVAGVEEVTLSWTPPTDLGTGGGILSRYEYRQTQGSTVSGWIAVAPAAATATMQVVGNLTVGEVYGFEVRAVGSGGLAGAPTTKMEATPLATPPPTFGDKTIADQAYTVNTAITALELPEATGGMGTLTYTLMPALPNGLSFDMDSRMVTGMPDTVAPAAEYTYKVTDASSGEASLTFTIAVTEPDTTDPVFPVSTLADQTYTADTVITDLVLPAATDSGALTYTLTPPVPPGLSFDADTRTLSGTPDTGQEATLYTYTATDASGNAETLTFMITVSEAATVTFDAGEKDVAVGVYPNPSGDALHVELPLGEYKISVLTLTGQAVLGERQVGGGSRTLDLSSLTRGVYVLKVEDHEGVSQTFRIIR